jgi:hypothetical protein
MAIFLLVLLPALSFLSGLVGLQADPNTERRKKLAVVLVLALSAIGSVVASLYQQQSDEAAKKIMGDALDKIQGSNARVEGTTSEIESMLVSIATNNGFSLKFVQARERTGFAPADLKLVQQSVTADGLVLTLAPEVEKQNQRQQTTVTYFAKDVDPSNVNGPALIKALGRYGFAVQEHKNGERNPTLPTNAVWAGDNVSPEQWKLVALTLVRAGLQIRSIRRFARQPGGPPRKANVIEIGADRQIQNDPPKTVQEIQDMKSLSPR